MLYSSSSSLPLDRSTDRVSEQSSSTVRRRERARSELKRDMSPTEGGRELSSCPSSDISIESLCFPVAALIDDGALSVKSEAVFFALDGVVLPDFPALLTPVSPVAEGGSSEWWCRPCLIEDKNLDAVEEIFPPSDEDGEDDGDNDCLFKNDILDFFPAERGGWESFSAVTTLPGVLGSTGTSGESMAFGASLSAVLSLALTLA
mmetsp:Transcript_21463/g.31128  ORF Transcript_21463/g.31128 Transcript_21463/m.31128 type:complete len:204 (+) Transcript_21463:2695-3306(+)